MAPLPSGLGILVRFQFCSRVVSWVKSVEKSEKVDDMMEETLTVVELLINAASATQDVLAEENGIDVIGGAVRIRRVDIFNVYQHSI